MYENKESGSESVPWQQVILRYHGNEISSSIKLTHVYKKARQILNNIH